MSRKLKVASKPTIMAAELDCAGGPYTVRSAGELMAMPTIEQKEIWGGICFDQAGSISMLVAPPGVGKSRLILNLACHQILGWDFAGMPTWKQPLRWLIFNAENSPARVQKDLSGFRACKAAEKKLIAESLFITTLEKAGDGDIALDRDRNGVAVNTVRIADAVRRVQPDVVVIDTLAAMNPDEMDAVAIRTTLSDLQAAIAKGTDRKVAVILIVHGRPGVKEAAAARGPDALSYARGSRVLVGRVRVAWNIRIGEMYEPREVFDAANPPPLIDVLELVMAKSNDGRILPPVAVRLDEKLFRYVSVEGFDHDSWQSTLEKMAKANETRSPARKAAEAHAQTESVEDKIVKILDRTGPISADSLIQELFTANCAASGREAQRLISRLRDAKILFADQPRKNQRALMYSASQYAALMRERLEEK